jgi:TolA-binding protein
MRAVARIENGKFLGGAMDGKRFRSIMLDLAGEHPDFVDTGFWIGVYEYGADVLPGYIKFFKRLLFLPGGSRDRGFELLEDVAARGILDRFNAHYMLDSFYAEQGRQEDRRQILERFVAAYPDYPWAAVMLAWSYAGRERPDFERAIRLHAEMVTRIEAREGPGGEKLLYELRLDLGRLYQSALDHRKAAEILRPLHEAARGDEERETSSAYYLVISLNRIGQHDEAVKIFEDVETRYPEANLIGPLRTVAEQFDTASGEVYEATIPARVLARDDKPQEAEAAFRESLRQYPGHPEIHFRMGEFYMGAERYAKAEAHFLRAVADEPAHPSYVAPYGRLVLGQICDLTDRRREAKDHYRLAKESAGGYDGVRRAAKHFLKSPYTRND